MKKKVTRVLAFLMMILLITAIPMNSFAKNPEYANYSTVKIKCNATKTYGFNVSNGLTCFYGDVQIQKGGAFGPDKVRVFFAPTNWDGCRNVGSKWSISITIKTTDGKSRYYTETREVTKDLRYAKVTNDNGTKKTTSIDFAKYVCATTTPWVKGTLWKALSSVTVVITQTGISGGNLKITLKT
ncbi:MAG: hypothetical protein IKN72_08955 [Clostridia bacterium]|nr:hypothetical protein [Clostridia bacterium]